MSELPPVIPWQSCIAKTDDSNTPIRTIKEHSLQTAEVARALKQILPSSLQKWVTDEVITLTGLHDLGKISPGFQKKIHKENTNSFETDHAMIGAAALDGFLKSRFKSSNWANIIALHHGSIRKRHPLIDKGSAFGGENWTLERNKFLRVISEKYGSIENRKLEKPTSDFVSGLVTLSDWIASDENFFTDKNKSEELQASEAINECGFFKPDLLTNLSFEDIFDFEPHSFQNQFIEAVGHPGLYILEAPMGLGKTEAALFAAYQLMTAGYHHGFYFGLPTRLTSDRIHERVEKFIRKICEPDYRVMLAHSTAWLNEFGRGGEGLDAGSSWFNARKRTLLYPFGVGTIDQALLSILRVKHYFLRAFALAGKVVILDEVHSYDMYTGSLMKFMIHHLLKLNCTVILLSATLTHERKQTLFAGSTDLKKEQGYPLITHQSESKILQLPGTPDKRQRYQIHLEQWDNTSIANQAVAMAEAGQNVLCIANTVAKAQTWYDAIQCETKADGYPVGLLHSKFPGFRRGKIEDEWMERLGKNGSRPTGSILIATQVVEQSVDIDADCLMTELAPTDMLLQRMGRIWRHSHPRVTSEPHVYIITGSLEQIETREALIEGLGKPNCFVYSPYVLWQTYGVWKNISEVILPDDIRGLLEATYQEKPDLLAFEKEILDIHNKRNQFLEQMANASTSDIRALPDMDDKEDAHTRYSDVTTMQCLLVKKVESSGNRAEIVLLNESKVIADRDVKNFYVTKEMHKNLVTLSVYQLKKSGVSVRKDDYKYLKKHFFDAVPVLEWDINSGRLFCQRQETALTYTHERGIGKSRGSKDIKQATYSDYEALDIFSYDW